MQNVKLFEEFVNENFKKPKLAGLSLEKTKKVAQKFADALSIADKKKYTVNPDIEEDAFDLDIDGVEFDGGSYIIHANGDVMNMAIWNSKHESPVYGDYRDDVKTLVKKIKKVNSSNF